MKTWLNEQTAATFQIQKILRDNMWPLHSGAGRGGLQLVGFGPFFEDTASSLLSTSYKRAPPNVCLSGGLHTHGLI